MYTHHIYLNTYIDNKHINDHIEVRNNYKRGEIKLSDQIINGELSTKIEFIPELNGHDRDLKENWDKLQQRDKDRLIKNGVVKEGDIKKNTVVEIKYKYK